MKIRSTPWMAQAIALLVLTLSGTSPAFCQNMLPNGDFEMGTTGFSSAAAFVPSGALASGEYSVRSDPSTANGQWCQPDHTSGLGNMLTCDGISGSATAAWRKTMNLIVGDTYAFEAWVNNLICTNSFTDPVMELRVDGVTLAGPLTLPESPDQWIKLSATFVATGSSTMLEVVSTSFAGTGNDFAIDDVSLVSLSQAPPAVIYTVSDQNVLTIVDIDDNCAITAVGVTRDADGTVRQLGDLAYDASLNTLYGITNGGDLVTVDRATGTTVQILSLPSNGLNSWSSLEVGNGSGLLYAVDSASTHQMILIDAVALSTTVIGGTFQPDGFVPNLLAPTGPNGATYVIGAKGGPVGGDVALRGLAKSNGTYYAYKQTSNQIVELEETSATVGLGGLNASISNPRSLAFRPGSQSLYTLHSDGTLATFIVSTGQSQVICQLPFSIGTTGGGLTFGPTTNPGPFGFSIATLGGAEISAVGSSLRVGNLGSSGNDGISIDFGGSFSGVGFDFEDLQISLEDEGSGFEVVTHMTTGGVPTIGPTVGMSIVGGNMAVAADFTSIGATEINVAYWKGGVLLSSEVLPGGGVPFDICCPPTNCALGFVAGKVRSYVFSNIDGVPMWTFAGMKWGCVLDPNYIPLDEFEFMTITPVGGSAPDSIDGVEFFGTNLADFTITEQGAQLDQTLASGLGGVSILPDGDNLKVAIPNLGSSGNDGIAFSAVDATGDPTSSVGELSVSYLLPDLNGQEGLGFDVSFFGIEDEDATNIRIDLDSVPNPNYDLIEVNGKPVLICVTPPNPAIPNPVPFTMELYNGGILVATMLNQTVGSSFSVTQTQPIGQWSVMATTDPVFMKVDTFPSGSIITTSSGLSVVGDEVRMIPNSTTQTLIGITSVEVTNITVPEMVFTGTNITAKPWTKLTGSLAGALGAPTLIGAGPLTSDSDNALVLVDGVPSNSSVLVLGFANISASFKSGVLVPSPDFLVSLLTDAAGGFTLPFTWPSGVPSGVSFYTQVWIPDATAPNGFSVTNGQQGTTP